MTCRTTMEVGVDGRRRRAPRLVTPIASMVMLGMLLAPPARTAEASSDGDGRPRPRPSSIDDTARRVAEMLRASRPRVELPLAQAPPDEPLARSMAWEDLDDTLEAIDRWLASDDAATGRALAFRNLVTASRRTAGGAYDAMVQVRTDFAGALRQLEQAVRVLTAARTVVRAGSPGAAWADQIMNQLTAVGARLAEDGLLRARMGGVDPQRIDRAARALAEGLDFKARGDYVNAFDGFADGLTVGAVPQFDLDLFEDNLDDVFDPETVGFQYAIARNGVLERVSEYGQTGLARTNADVPQESQVGTKEINIASISKPLTAMVLLHLLDDRNVDIDSPIAPWLPADWVLGPNMAQLTFRELLTHTSGLNANLNSDYRYDDLRDYAEAGINPADKTFKYQNANFAMFRVAIPYLRFGANGVDGIAALVPFAPFAEVIAGIYIETVREIAFAPTGFVEAGCVPSDPTPTMYYPQPPNGQAGLPPGDWITQCGSGGWYMSSVELVGVMAFRRYSNMILSPAMRQAMDFGFLGWMNPARSGYGFAKGLYGVYRTHGGDLTNALDACYMEFFNDVQVAVIANSADGNYLGNGSYQCSGLKWAFENAFVVP